jgi:uncharacterized damage-inducible protein DinB
MGTLGEATAQRLEAAMGRLIATVDGLDEATLHRMPGEGEWSAIETLAHVAEMVPFWAHRARQVASGEFADRAYGRSPEEYELRNAAIADHGHDSLAAMVAWLQSSAKQAADTLRGISDEGWMQSALYGSEQVRHTVSQLVEERIIDHVEAHIHQAAEAAQQARTA